jgi:hypothetical protein
MRHWTLKNMLWYRCVPTCVDALWATEVDRLLRRSSSDKHAALVYLDEATYDACQWLLYNRRIHSYITYSDINVIHIQIVSIVIPHAWWMRPLRCGHCHETLWTCYPSCMCVIFHEVHRLYTNPTELLTHFRAILLQNRFSGLNFPSLSPFEKFELIGIRIYYVFVVVLVSF